MYFFSDARADLYLPTLVSYKQEVIVVNAFLTSHIPNALTYYYYIYSDTVHKSNLL